MSDSNKLLLVFATLLEARKVMGDLPLNSLRSHNVEECEPQKIYSLSNRNVDLVVTGVGILNTLQSLSPLNPLSYRGIINLGIAGVYPEAQTELGLKLTSVVQVVEDRLGDLGAEDGENFVSFDNTIYSSSPEKFSFMTKVGQQKLSDLPSVKGVTVQCCTGSLQTAKRRQKMGQIESMEGAAVAAWCKQVQLPWLQLRALSNVATTRNKGEWKTEEALSHLKKTIEKWIPIKD